MSTTTLSGYRVLVIVTNYGVEQDELVVPVEHLRERGATVVVAAASAGPVQTLVGDKDPGRTVQPDATLDAPGSDFDLLVVPGGTLNADSLRRESAALDAVRDFTSSGRPIAAICHGPWVLVEADVVRDRTLTSFPSLQTDLRNAGATWVDEAVSVDRSGRSVLVTSRTPDDLDDFLTAIEEVLATRHEAVPAS
jgi:protease I